MPINFTPYTQPVAPQNWNTPLEPSIYAQGVSNQAKRLENQSLIDSNSAENILGITAIAPQDEEQLQKIQQAFKEDVSKLNMSDLKNPQTKQQLDQQIAKYQDLLLSSGIPQRSAAVQKELATKKEIEAKGEKYISPLLNQAEDYIQNGEFYKDTRFNRSGWVDPNVEKMKTEALKNVRVVKKQTLVNGNWIETEEYDPEQLQTSLLNVYNNPLVQKTMDYQFDKKYKDFDFATEGVNKVTSLFNEAEMQKQNAYYTLQKAKKGSPEYQKAMEDYTEAESFVTKYTPLLENPGKLGEDLKRQYKQDEINNQVKNDIIGSQFKSESAIKESQFALNNQKYAQDLQQKQAESLSLGASLNGWSLQETLNDPAKMQKALADSQQAKLAEFSQKENIKLQNKIVGKENAIKGGFKFTDSDIISYTDEKGDTKTLQYGTFKQEIKRASGETAKRMIAAVLNQKNSTDGNWIPLTPDQVTITGVGDKRKIKINSTYGFGGESIPIDDVIDISNFTQSATKNNNSTMNVWGRDWKMTTVTYEGKKIQVVSPQTIEEYNNIPSGVKYYDTDGQLKIK